MGRLVWSAVGLLIAISSTAASARQELKTTELAAAFGELPAAYDVRMSPDGRKVSYLDGEVDGHTFLAVTDLVTAKSSALVRADFGDFEINSCRWANAERLLCMFSSVEKSGGVWAPSTRMLALNADGSKQVWLVNDNQRATQYASEIVDLLPDDPTSVILQRQIGDESKLERVNIYNNKSDVLEYGSETVDGWLTDGRGKPRIRITTRGNVTRWDYTVAGSDKWHRLHERVQSSRHPADQGDYFEPAGFGNDPNILYFFSQYNGRRALWKRDLSVEGDASGQVVYARDDVDLGILRKIGKYRRAYAVSYITDYPHLKMFDTGIDKVLRSIDATIPGKAITVYDESWDRRYYLVQIRSDKDPGDYYRLDAQKPELMRLAKAFPRLKGRQLAEMVPVTYKAADGTKIPGYLTVPAGGDRKGLPLVVMPHGGPQARDEWGFDFLAQYIAAKGYAVLQSNYRGSNGYGDDWAGAGGYREWRRVVSDINDGVRALIADGTVDANRVCAVGWSFGGYAALLSAIEAKDLYKCVASIAGVTDPITEADAFRGYTNYKIMKDWIGVGDRDIAKNGSPLRRAEELNVPIILFHGTRDVNVSIKNSLKLRDKLKRLHNPVDYVEYEDAQHDIWRNAYRIDMLTRIGKFLDRYIGAH